jgi:hypothetical protein
MIPVAVVLATSALLSMTAAAPFTFAERGDSRDKESETNEKLKSEADCNFNGKGNTCIQVPINIKTSMNITYNDSGFVLALLPYVRHWSYCFLFF